jgi:hypothetical protein
MRTISISRKGRIRRSLLSLLATIAEDEPLRKGDQTGEPVWNIPEDSAIYIEIDRFMKNLM